MELIIVIAIMGVLLAVIAPTMMGHLEKARQVKIETEASEFTKTAQIALVDVTSQGRAPGADAIKNKTKSNSPYYKLDS